MTGLMVVEGMVGIARTPGLNHLLMDTPEGRLTLCGAKHLNEYRADSMWQRSPCPRCNRRLHVGPVRATVAPADLEAIDAAVNELVAAQQRFKEALAKARGSRTSSLRGPLAKAVTAGLRLQELADVLGVSRERIRQVAERPQRRRSAR